MKTRVSMAMATGSEYPTLLKTPPPNLETKNTSYVSETMNAVIEAMAILALTPIMAAKGACNDSQNIPLATMLAVVPTPTSPQQLKGVTAFIYACNGQPQLCYPVYNGLGTAVITTSINCNTPTMIVLYQIGSTYLAYMQLQVPVTFNIGNTYSYEIGVSVS